MTATEPYLDSVDHVRAELARLDVILRHRLEAWWEETDGVHDELRNLYISDDEVDGLLEPGLRDIAEERRETPRTPLSEHLTECTDELRRRSRLTSPSSEETPRLLVLFERFELDRSERDVLLVALAPELDRKYERIYGYLQDDITKTRPTVDFALRVLSHAETDSDHLHARAVVGTRSPLVRNRLVSVGPGTDRPIPSRTLLVDDRITEFVLGSDALDARLDGVETVRPTGTLDGLAVEDELRTTLARLASAEWRRESDGPPAVYLFGPEGGGRDAAVEALCRPRSELLVADVRSVSNPDDPAWSSLLSREARLRDAPVYVKGVDATEDATAALFEALDGFDGPVFASGTERLSASLRTAFSRHELVTVGVPPPSYEARRALWEAHGLPPDVDSDALAATFRMTPGQIDDAVQTATRDARMAGEPLSKETLYRSCRAQTNETLEALARKVEPSYDWDDIVLPDDRLTQLREVAAHVKHRGTVYAEWGFEEKFSLGNGIVVLFTGPSGTGKTMAAEIVAGDAGLDLYKIDLSSVVSKYIGETEKNLRRIFDEAEDANVVLLFDEADALFGKRSEVKDAHDRYANIEVDYLLQRLEEHDGTVVLTTNFKRNIDDAFLRRIHLSVDFPMPDRQSRAAIWRSIFPAETPVEALDVEFLAGFEVSGGNVKNVALTAAFLAADDERTVTMRHVVRSMERELQKTGRTVRPDEFGRYRSFLSP